MQAANQVTIIGLCKPELAWTLPYGPKAQMRDSIELNGLRQFQHVAISRWAKSHDKRNAVGYELLRVDRRCRI
jgi:hypothetical protein